MQSFDFERLDVYKAAIEMVVLIKEIQDQLPKGKGYLADQLQRAGTSIVLNIAEGGGEFAMNEKGRFYRMAKRSATECASILNICHRLGIIAEFQYAKGRELLLRIVSMLTKMTKMVCSEETVVYGQSGTLTHAGTFTEC